MKRIALIGLGTISRYYKKRLENSPVFRLIATSDVSQTPSAREVYKEYPFYADYKQMEKTQRSRPINRTTSFFTHKLFPFFIDKICPPLKKSLSNF